MKNLLLLAILTLATQLASAAQSLSSVTFNWSSSNGSSDGWPNCGATVTTICVNGYTLTDVTESASPVVISSAILHYGHELCSDPTSFGWFAHVHAGH